MKISITGHSKGIGAALHKLLSATNIVEGFSRSNGYDISIGSDINAIIELSKDSDVFINNAYHDLSQTTIFEKLLALWYSDPTKTIVNINSRTIYNPPNNRDYTKFKKVLRSAATKAFLDTNRKCRIININPGYVKTDMTANGHSTYKMLTPEQLADMIKWSIDQPQDIEIGELSVWCTTL